MKHIEVPLSLLFFVECDQDMTQSIFYRTKLKLLYMYTGGFYTYSIFALIFWETRRSDFGVTMSHHVATVVLILFSYIARYVENA